MAHTTSLPLMKMRWRGGGPGAGPLGEESARAQWRRKRDVAGRGWRRQPGTAATSAPGASFDGDAPVASGAHRSPRGEGSGKIAGDRGEQRQEQSAIDDCFARRRVPG